MELVVAQAGYKQEKPHLEEFFIPKQCEAYNLFQEINIKQTADDEGNLITQQAVFKHALFDVDLLLKEKFDIENHVYQENNTQTKTGIYGNIAHSDSWDAKGIEVVLLNEKDQIIRITRTDDQGDFVFEKLDTTIDYRVLINEDEAITSYNNWSESHPSEFYMQGILYDYSENGNGGRANTTIYLAKGDKIITDLSITDQKGEFEFLNPTTPLAIIEELNDNTTITYNLDQSDSEILYSALLTTIDPNNNDLEYTEHIDIVDLKKLTETDAQMKEFANILFDFDKFFLRQKSENILENLYLFMEENPSVEVKLDGHTDWIGTDQYNEALSKKRAIAAHKYLIDKGISPDRIENKWFGESKPIVANANPDGSDNPNNRQLNRRVEIKVEIPELADLYLSL